MIVESTSVDPFVKVFREQKANAFVCSIHFSFYFFAMTVTEKWGKKRYELIIREK